MQLLIKVIKTKKTIVKKSRSNYTYTLMESSITQKTPLIKKLYSEDEIGSKREKKFPKIQEVDPDQKKKKKPEDETVSIFSPTLQKIEITLFEEVKAAAARLEELSFPIIQEISLQKENGITKTSFTIQTKTFDTVEIHLTLYDTNPLSYHVRLLGNERLMQLSMMHQNILEGQIKSAIPAITLHIATPRLREKDRFSSKKVKKSIEKSKRSWYGSIEGA